MVSLQVVDGASTRDVTGSLDSGTIGGDLRFRDSVAVQLATDVDQLAFDFASALNGVHQANAAVDGSTGRPLFSVTGSATGAAAAIAVDPAIAGDSSLVAAAGAGQGSSSNQGAIDLLALRDQALAAGGARRFGDEAIRMLADLGREAATARADREFQDAQRSGLASLRDSISGVSIQEELTRLSQFKNAADATSRFLATIDGLLGRLIQDL
jgi:flagellar hook-associated protein 1 FlgK